MRRVSALASLVTALTLSACASSRPPLEEPLRSILRRPPDPQRHRVQVILGTLETGADGRPALRQVAYRAGAEYFYPASTVKLLGAVAALERLGQLRDQTIGSGHDLGVDTPLVYHPLFEGETLEDRDPSNVGAGTITLRHQIRKLFLVSDNEAFNKLYEFAGQDGLAASLERAGIHGARIVHRLSEPRSAEENLRSPRIEFVERFEDQEYRHEIAARTASPMAPAPPLEGLLVGHAYMSGEQKVAGPMDFAPKNRIALADLQRALCMVVRPDVDCGGLGFQLTEADRSLLLEPMSQYPRESPNPVYDPAEYPDDYAKYLLPGLERVMPRERFRIYNKIGQAYGFMTENAWVADTRTGRGFFLAATIYVNQDGVLNDDKYEYDTVARPFFAKLGEDAARWFWSQPKKK